MLKKMIKDNKGFTLVEVLVTMALLGFISMAFLTVFSVSSEWIFGAGYKNAENFEDQRTLERDLASSSPGNSDTLSITFDSGTSLDVEGEVKNSGSFSAFHPVLPTAGGGGGSDDDDDSGDDSEDDEESQPPVLTLSGANWNGVRLNFSSSDDNPRQVRVLSYTTSPGDSKDELTDSHVEITPQNTLTQQLDIVFSEVGKKPKNFVSGDEISITVEYGSSFEHETTYTIKASGNGSNITWNLE